MLESGLGNKLFESRFMESDKGAILDLQGGIGAAVWDARAFSRWRRVPRIRMRFLRERACPGAAVAFFVACFPPHTRARSLYLANFGVASAWRRRGVGRYTLSLVEEHARRRGLERIELHVEESNLPAQCLYRAMGYLVVKIERSGYGHEDAYHMVRELDRPAASP